MAASAPSARRGLVVNTLLLALLADVAGIYYVAAAILATQGSTLWNFCLTEAWVFAGRDHERSLARRALLFFAMNNAALALRVPLLFVLTTGLGIHYLASNILTLVALTVIRFVVADGWIWAKAQRREVGSYSYDIHGIVTVTSEVRLPELQRFMVPEALSRPTIRVRIGHMRAAAAAGNGTAHSTATRRPTVNGNSPAHVNGSSTRARSRGGAQPRRARERKRQRHAQPQVHRGLRGPRLRGRDLPGGRARRSIGRSAAPALAPCALHERG